MTYSPLHIFATFFYYTQVDWLWKLICMYIHTVNRIFLQFQSPVLSQLHCSDNRTCKSALKLWLVLVNAKTSDITSSDLPGPCFINIVSDTNAFSNNIFLWNLKMWMYLSLLPWRYFCIQEERNCSVTGKAKTVNDHNRALIIIG